MANYNKSFNFRNGVQVDDDNFIVNPNGLVGIGTSIPREFLDVHGTAKITGLVTARNLAVTGVSTFYSEVKVGSGIALYASTGIVSATAFYGDASNMTGVEQVVVDGWIINAGNISTTSKVGIGTTLPSSQLDVVGNIKVSGIVTAPSFSGYQVLVGTESSATKIFSVKVASKTSNHRYTGIGSANAYFIDGIESPFLTLLPGKIYYFDQSDVSNIGNRLSFYLEADKATLYNTNVTTSAEVPGTFGSYTQIIVTDTTPVVLQYQSLSTSGAYMGNAVQFNSNIVNTPYQITTLAGISATTGVVTAYSFSGFGTNIQGINATNITNGTLNNSRLPQSISISGIITASSGIITSLTSTNLNNTGIATLGIVTASQLYVSGVTTFLQGFVGNVTGIASTALSLSGTPNISVTNITSSNINNSGIATLGNINSSNINNTGIITSLFSSIGVSTVSTRLYAERIGVGTNSPSGDIDIHIRRPGQSRLQVTSDTAEAIIAIGRSTTLAGSNGALIFGNTAGIYPYSNSKTLDVVNYDTGNINQYLNFENFESGTGNFNWIYGQNSNNPLMSLTYQGNLGIGITNPTNKLQVSGSISASSLSLSGNITATGAATSTSVRTLYVYGGKSQILNENGTSIFPAQDTNLNLISGVSTFYNINATGAGTSTSVRTLYVYGGKSQILNENGTSIFPAQDTNLNVISGVSTFYDINVTANINTNSNINATGAGTSTSVRTLYVYGGKSQILNENGTSIFPAQDTNLNVISGVSTFYDINVSNYGIFGQIIGIGTTTPTSNLHVVGDALITGFITLGTGATTSSLFTNDLSVAGVSTHVGISTFQSTLFGTQSSFTGVTTTAILNVGTNGNIITTTTDGLVGIGTTTPTSKLHVVGDALITGVTTSQNGFTSGIGVTNPVKITVSGNILTFTVTGVGSTSLTLY